MGAVFFYSGQRNTCERGAEFMFMNESHEEEKTEFELSGLNADELERMSGVERRKIMKAAGLNPDDYDF